jgi:hypothetical protein
LLVDERSRQAVEVAERFADGQASDAELATAATLAWEALHRLGGGTDRAVYDSRWAAADARLAAGANIDQTIQTMTNVTMGAVIPGTAPLLRDIFGNPFRPLVVDGAWLTATVMALAQATHDERLLP